MHPSGNLAHYGPGVVDLLLKAGADANLKHLFHLPLSSLFGIEYGTEAGILCQTALQAASVEGDVKTVKLLLDAGAALEDLGGECGTPLQAAAAGGPKRVVELLLRAGTNAKVVHSFQFLMRNAR